MADEIELLRLFGNAIPGPSTDAWARARAAVATAQSEEQTVIFHNVTARGRSRRLWLAAGAGAAAAVAGLLAIVLPGAAPQVQAAAYVSRVERALSQPAVAGLVGYARTILPPGTAAELTAEGIDKHLRAGASSPSDVRTMVRWAYRDASVDLAFTATGQRVYAARLAGPQIVAVMYSDSTWWRAVSPPAGGSAGPSCPPGLAAGPAGWPAAIRAALQCGTITSDGRQRVDGVDAIKLASSKGLAVWVNPRTYLPVRIITAVSGAQVQTDFRWLPATAASLAHLSLAVPAGFRKVPPPA